MHECRSLVPDRDVTMFLQGRAMLESTAIVVVLACFLQLLGGPWQAGEFFHRLQVTD